MTFFGGPAKIFLVKEIKKIFEKEGKMRKFRFFWRVGMVSLLLISGFVTFLYVRELSDSNKVQLENQKLRDTLRDLQLILEPPSPEIIGGISIEELRDLLIEKVGGGGVAYLLDKRYRLISLDDFKEFLAIDTTDDITLLVDFFDCDNHARRLWGMMSLNRDWGGVCFGFALGCDDHAYNLFVTRENGELVLYMIDPKSDEISRVDNKICLRLIIF